MSETSKKPDIELSAPIVEVIMYRNGARVTRKGRVAVPQGSNTIVIKDLPDVIDDGTFKVSGKGTGQGKIVSISLSEQHGTDSNVEIIRDKETQLAGLKEKHAILAHRAEFYAAHHQDLINMRASYLDSYPFFLPEEPEYQGRFLFETSPGAPANPKQAFEAFLQSNTKVTEHATTVLGDIQREMEGTSAHIDVLSKQLDQIRQKQQVLTYKQAQIDVNVSKAGEFTFTIEYVIYQGRWSPIYDVFLDDDAGSVLIKMYASITNTTKEDWKDVQLTVSSADLRPVRLVEPQPWILRERIIYPAAPMAMARAPAPRMKAEMAVGGAPGSMMDAAPAPPPPKPKAEIPKAEVGGSPLGVQIFKLPVPVSLNHGSWDNNIFLLDAKLDSKTEYFYNTDVKRVIIQNRIQNKDMQFLPGTARMFVVEDFVSQTNLPSILPGEEFILGTRESHDLKIEKKLVKRVTDKGGITRGKVDKEYAYEVTVENLAGKTHDLVLFDTVPHADSELVKVQLGQMSHEPVENKLGVLKWQLKLGELEKKIVIKYGYSVSYDKDVRLETPLP